VAVKLGVVGGGGGRVAEWLLLLDGRRSTPGSGDELDENDCSVCVAFESGRHTAVVVTGCLASPGHGVTGNCEGLFDRTALTSRR
jgi:hypothetical protein